MPVNAPAPARGRIVAIRHPVADLRLASGPREVAAGREVPAGAASARV
jgi:hypothetical protein